MSTPYLPDGVPQSDTSPHCSPSGAVRALPVGDRLSRAEMPRDYNRRAAVMWISAAGQRRAHSVYTQAPAARPGRPHTVSGLFRAIPRWVLVVIIIIIAATVRPKWMPRCGRRSRPADGSCRLDTV